MGYLRIFFYAFIIVFLLGLPLFIFIPRASSDELDDITKEINDLTTALEQSIAATTPLESQVSSMQQQIANLKHRISILENDLQIKKKEIEISYENLEQKQMLLKQIIKAYYVKSYAHSPLLLLSNEGSDVTRQLAYEQTRANQDKALIANLTFSITTLETRRAELAFEQKKLVAAKLNLDEQSGKLNEIITGAKAYQKDVSSKIAALSARQQEILAEKSGTFQTTVGDVPLADDPNSRPDYNPGFSPAFAAFSFGAPHFRGMSQYGAFGRAKQGQGNEEILKAYYGSGIEIRDGNQGENITVDGFGSYSLEEYAKRIYEMPGSWGDENGMEALKAQAIAARSYGLARMRSSGSICSTESCQVFKPSPKGGKWEEAVNATAGKVIFVNGQPFSAWYASTSGGYQESYSYNGYSTPGFWDTPSGRGGWTSQAYEKTADSPWFYKGWYRSRSGDSCGRNHPWLTSEEMADILNGWKVLFEGGGDSSRVTPEGSCWGGNPYSKDELRGIGGFTNVSGVSVNYSDSGVTANVTLQTNKGSLTINGNDFYKTFNLRAPGRISLKSGLFNIEKK